MKSKNNRVYSFVLFTSIGILAYIIGLCIFTQSPQSIGIPSYITLFAASFFMLVLTKSGTVFRNKFTMSNAAFLSALTATTFLLRLLWILPVNTGPVSDFYLYHLYAANASKGVFDSYDPTYSLFPFKFGYPLILSLVYRLFGAAILTAKLFNAFMSTCLVLVIYWIAKRVFDQEAARTAAVFFTFLPSQIMYNSVLGSEHVFSLFFCLGLALFIEFQSRLHEKKVYAGFLAAGASMAIANFTRPVSIILFPVIAIYLIFIYSEELHLPKSVKLLTKTAVVATIFLGFITVFSLLNFTQYSLTHISAWHSSTGFNLLVGTNYDSSGKYSSEDEQKVNAFKNDLNKFHQASKEIAINRIKASPVGFLKLIEKKYAVQWANEDYGYYWSTLKFDKENAVSSFLRNNNRMFYYISFIFYLSLLCFSLLGCFYIYKSSHKTALLLLLIFEAFFAAHTFLEVQSRYHYPVIPFFLILAGYGFNQYIHSKPMFVRA